MLAGGVNHADDLFLHVGFCALKALSPSGRSRPFHRDADGLVPAEGAAFVALQAARRRRRRAATAILGVIRGVGLSNDGRGARAARPDPRTARMRAMRAAYAAAGLAPARRRLVECHATGHAGRRRRRDAHAGGACSGARRRLAIGSLKGNLGPPDHGLGRGRR